MEGHLRIVRAGLDAEITPGAAWFELVAAEGRKLDERTGRLSGQDGRLGAASAEQLGADPEADCEARRWEPYGLARIGAAGRRSARVHQSSRRLGPLYEEAAQILESDGDEVEACEAEMALLRSSNPHLVHSKERDLCRRGSRETVAALLIQEQLVPCCANCKTPTCCTR
jgi:hypothetical protein